MGTGLDIAFVICLLLAIASLPLILTLVLLRRAMRRAKAGRFWPFATFACATYVVAIGLSLFSLRGSGVWGIVALAAGPVLSMTATIWLATRLRRPTLATFAAWTSLVIAVAVTSVIMSARDLWGSLVGWTLWLIIVAVVATPGFVKLRSSLRTWANDERRRRSPDSCAACDYPLPPPNADAVRICPECGARSNPAPAAPPHAP